MGKLPFFIRTRASALLSSLVLAACASTPIEEAPVADRSSAPAAGTAGPGAGGQSSVAPVAAARPGADAAGPLGAARVVYFDYDSSAIRPEFQSVIDSHARFLGSHQARKIMIAGHTDERGGREYNLALGQQRAEAVRRALQLLGARAAQVETISFGEEKPEAAGHEEAAWSRNRRAELSYR
jgi:peptidoglycan-associated lipoprotein